MRTVPHLLCFTVEWLYSTLTVWNWKIVCKVLWKRITEIENTGLHMTQTILVDSVVASQKTVIGKKSNAHDSKESPRFGSRLKKDIILVSKPEMCHITRELKVKRKNLYLLPTSEFLTKCLIWFRRQRPQQKERKLSCGPGAIISFGRGSKLNKAFQRVWLMLNQNSKSNFA